MTTAGAILERVATGRLTDIEAVDFVARLKRLKASQRPTRPAFDPEDTRSELNFDTHGS